MASSIIEVEGKPVEALVREGEGPTLILLHGSGLNHRCYDPLCAALDGLSLLVPSYPGRLGSAGPPLSSATELGGWVDALAAVHGGDCVMVGHSVGGAVAQELGLAHSRGQNAASVRALVLVATGARLHVHPAIMSSMQAAAAEGHTVPFGDIVFRQDTPAEMIRRCEEAATQTNPQSVLADWTASHTFDRLGDVGAINLPTLVISGDEDPLTPPKYATYLAENIPRAQLVSISGAGHMFPIERADEVAQHIRRFVRSL